MRKVLTGVLIAAVVALVAGSPGSWLPLAHAANIAVNTTADELNSDGDCSLREAIQAANSNAAVDACTAGSGADAISLPAGTYTLSVAGADEFSNATGDLNVTDDVTINGAGADVTIIDANGIDRVMTFVADGSISGLTLTGGNSPNAGGGAIRTGGTIELSGVAVVGNTSEDQGGGIFNGGALTIVNSTLSGNSSTADQGGAIFTLNSDVTIINSTISGNSADETGGAIFHNPPRKGTNTVVLQNVTITGNTSSSGAVFTFEPGVITARNTIIAANASSASGGPDVNGEFTSEGHNLIGDTTGATILGDTTGNITGQDSNLGPLADNGGPTQTHALLAGSPAIDAGDPSAPGSGGTACEPTDQRGVTRPQDGDDNGSALCDIGAFELELGGPAPTPTEPPPPEGGGVVVSVSDDSPEVGDTVDISVTATDDAGNPVSGVQCTFEITDQPGDDAVLELETATTDENGVATVGLSVGNAPGIIEVTADCGDFGTEVLEVVVSPSGLPATGGGETDASTDMPLAVALAALAAAAALGSAGFALRRK